MLIVLFSPFIQGAPSKATQRSMTLWSEWQKVSSIRDRVKLKQIQ